MRNFRINDSDDEHDNAADPSGLRERLLSNQNSGQMLNTLIGEQIQYGDLSFFTRKPYTRSARFYQDMLYAVPLSKLYKIVDTCFYSQGMPYCPILVKKEEEKTVHCFELQVWDKNGEIVYTKDLKSPPISWCVTNQVLVYLPSEEDQASQYEFCYYVIYLYRDNFLFKINVKGIVDLESISQPILGFCNKCIYISRNYQEPNEQSSVFILNMNELEPDITVNDFVNQTRPIKKVSIGRTLNHYFTILRDKDDPKRDANYIIMCCETSDNQIDYCRLFYYPQNMQYRIEQVSEIVSRGRPGKDKIKKFKVIYDNSRNKSHYAIALRASGHVDFYWNNNLIQTESEEQRALLFDDIEMDFNCFYLKEKESTNTYKIQLDDSGKIGLNQKKLVKKPCSEFIKLFQNKLTNHVNFYSSFCMVGTSFFLAHNNRVFVYDFQKETIQAQFTYNFPVMKLFRVEICEGVYSIVVILSQEVKILNNTDTHYLNPNNWVQDEQFNGRLDGKPEQMACYNQHPESLFILTKTQQGQKLQVFNHGRIVTLDDNIQRKIKPSTKIFALQGTFKDSKLVMLSQGIDGECTIHIVSSHLQAKQPPAFRIDRTIPVQSEQLSKDQIHAAITINIDETIFLFGKKHAYKINVNDAAVDFIPNARLMSVQLIDDNFCYAIIQKNNRCVLTENSGLKMFSLKTLLEINDLRLFDVEETVVSRNSAIDFSEDNQRLLFMKNFDTVHIIPPLHRSTISFIGMLPRDRYLAVKKVRNNFYALDKNNTITTWNALTGKILCQNPILSEGDYSDYQIFGFERSRNKDFTYSKEWNQPRTLLVSKTEATDNINMDLINSLKPVNEIPNSVPYGEQQDNQVSFRQFKFIEILDEFTVKEHLSFVHQYYTNKLQRIFISDDLSLMMEKLVNLRVLIYQQDTKNESVVWRLQKRFYDFPEEISKQSRALYLFSPDLLKHISFDIEKNCLVIKNTLDSEPGISLPIVSQNGDSSLNQDIVSRFRWVDNKKFLITSPWGFEKLYEIQDGSVDEIGSSQIPCFNELSKCPQIYFEKESLEIGTLQKRLIRKHQNLKRLRFLCGNSEHSMMYETLFSIDYNVNDSTGKFVSDLSFSYFQWKLIEEIEKGNRQIKDLDHCILSQLCLNILPGCRTLLHLLQKQSQELIYIIKQIPIASENFEMPFIRDLEGNTPLHYCVLDKDYRTAELFLQYLSKAPLDHHSRDIMEIMPALISNKIPSLLDYFDARIIQTEQLAHLNRGTIVAYSNSADWGMMSSSIWESPDFIKSRIFVKPDQNSKAFDTEVELKFLDLPYLHQLSLENCVQFFESLKDLKEVKDSDGFDIFELRSIRILIEYHWPLARKYTIQKLLYPFLLYLLSFWLYTNFIDSLGGYLDAINTVPWIINLSVLVVLSIYFLGNEVKQIMFSGMSYFKDPWNYIDLAPPTFVITIALINFANIDTEWESTLKSIGSLLMWLKLLYFLRINKNTGYLIRMIVKVIFRIRTFLSVLLITIIAIADAFVSIVKDEEYDEAEEGILGFFLHRITKFLSALAQSYFIILGGDKFEVKEQFELLSTVLTIFTTLFVMIIMLNLLISIIGDIYAKVQDNMINESYQERASIIAENSYLIPECVLQDNSIRPGQLLLFGYKKGFDINCPEDDPSFEKDNQRQEALVQRIEKALERKLENKERKALENPQTSATGLTSQATTFIRTTVFGKH